MMESLKSELLDIIAGGIPDTEENQKFCEAVDGGFIDMLDEVMAKIKERLVALAEED